MTKKRLFINGRFLGQKTTGVQRYAFEIVKELDQLIDNNLCEIVIPNNVDENLFAFKKIEVKKLYGRYKGIAWDLFSFSNYVRKNNGFALNLCNSPSLLRNSVVCIHDVTYRVNSNFHTSTKDRLRTLWNCMSYWISCHCSKVIITVSEFSKTEIMKYYHVPEQRICVINNAWQHMQRISQVDNIFRQYKLLKPNEYYFSMASLAANKNFKWILYAAQNNPEQIFAIAGGGELRGVAEAERWVDLPNVVFLGYVSDEEAKALMANCKAFLFPTLYEGFGIPPLEALACGAKHIILSDIPCMHEIYGDVAEYIDPYDFNFKFTPNNHEAMQEKKEKLLEKYSWKKSAIKVCDLITDLMCGK